MLSGIYLQGQAQAAKIHILGSACARKPPCVRNYQPPRPSVTSNPRPASTVGLNSTTSAESENTALWKEALRLYRSEELPSACEDGYEKDRIP
jgi:hypothetical protein